MYDDVEGEFDVVGYDEVGAPVYQPRGGQRGGSFHGRGAGSRSAQRGAMIHRGGAAGRGGAGAFNRGLPPGVNSPPWWKGTSGVNTPNEMLHVMPLVPDTNNGVFTAALTAATITFLARPQKPFRGERIISAITNFGPTATAQPQSTSIFVGVDLQQVEAGNIPLSTWAATAFGVRLAMVDGEPGIEIRIPVVLVGGALLTTDTITVAVTILGRVLA